MEERRRRAVGGGSLRNTSVLIVGVWETCVVSLSFSFTVSRLHSLLGGTHVLYHNEARMIRGKRRVIGMDEIVAAKQR